MKLDDILHLNKETMASILSALYISPKFWGGLAAVLFTWTISFSDATEIMRFVATVFGALTAIALFIKAYHEAGHARDKRNDKKEDDEVA